MFFTDHSRGVLVRTGISDEKCCILVPDALVNSSYALQLRRKKMFNVCVVIRQGILQVVISPSCIW